MHRNLCRQIYSMNHWCTEIYADRYIQWIIDAQESMQTYSMNHWCIGIYADRNIQWITDAKESTQTEIFNESFLHRNPQADIFNEPLLHRNQHRQEIFTICLMTNLCILIVCFDVSYFNLEYEMYVPTTYLRKGALRPYYYYLHETTQTEMLNESPMH